MNELGISLLWCGVQATLYLLIGLFLYGIVRRFGPAPGASAAASTLVMLCCISVAAFSPWPRWWTPSAGENLASDGGQKIDADQKTDAVGESLAPQATEAVSANGNAEIEGVTFSDYWKLFRAELVAARTNHLPTGQSRRWPAFVGGLLMACAMLALARVLFGIAALRRYRRSMTAIGDPALTELAASLSRQMACRRPIELKQSNRLATPATMGWRRPLILLPADWRSWSEEERRVVLAHEIAHIARGDYLAWLVAQFSVALHIYHPLVHWLAGRLRLEQELAADAWAAELSGGREAYLYTLAQMALRQDDRRVAWAARPFLPSRGTFLRRIEMLSETKPLRNVPISRGRAVVLAAVAATVGLIVSGVRAPFDPPRVAQAAPGETPKSNAKGAKVDPPMDLSFVPPRTVALLAVRPADILGNPDMQPLVQLLNSTAGFDKRTGLKLENIEEFKLALTRLPEPSQPGRPGQGVQRPQDALQQSILYSIRSKDAFDWKGKFAENLVGKPVEASIAGKTYYHSDQGDLAIRPAFYVPDDRTIVVGPEIDLQRAIVTAGKRTVEWAAEWQKSALGQAAVMVDLTALDRAVGAELNRQPQLADVFSPIWKKGQRLFISLQARDELGLAARIKCAGADDAAQVQATLQAALTLAHNLLDQADRNLAKAPAAQAAALVPLIDLATESLKQGKLRTEGSDVHYTTTLDLDVAETAVAVLAPAVIAARGAAQQSQANNNMKQIMLAMHVYYDVNQHFPAPAVIGPDGKTPHSWRVAILPYLEQEPLYRQYKLDEPWDSENNKRVLAQMPACFRDPSADPSSTDSCYFAIIGPGTAFGDKDSKGTKFQEITDGTSNTMAVVEAKRAIPWTKPEDIDYRADKPRPKLGGWHAGGFVTGFCDGSVRFLPETLDDEKLRAFITKAGGELITNP